MLLMTLKALRTAGPLIFTLAEMMGLTTPPADHKTPQIYHLSSAEIVDSLASYGVAPVFYKLTDYTIEWETYLKEEQSASAVVKIDRPRLLQLYRSGHETFRHLLRGEQRKKRGFSRHLEKLEHRLQSLEVEGLSISQQLEGAEQATRPLLKRQLTQCYQQQTSFIRLIDQAKVYQREIKSLFELVGEAQKTYSAYLQELSFEQRIASAQRLPVPPPNLLARAWDVLSGLRESESALRIALTNHQNERTDSLPHHLPTPRWSDLAVMIKNLETARQRVTPILQEHRPAQLSRR